MNSTEFNVLEPLTARILNLYVVPSSVVSISVVIVCKEKSMDALLLTTPFEMLRNKVSSSVNKSAYTKLSFSTLYVVISSNVLFCLSSAFINMSCQLMSNNTGEGRYTMLVCGKLLLELQTRVNPSAFVTDRVNGLPLPPACRSSISRDDKTNTT